MDGKDVEAHTTRLLVCTYGSYGHPLALSYHRAQYSTQVKRTLYASLGGRWLNCVEGTDSNSQSAYDLGSAF